MNNEPITKQQAIDLANRLQAFLGIAGASLYSKEVERLPSCWVSVKDRLPEPYVTVIVHMPLEAPLPTVGWGFITDDGTWYCNHFNRDEDEVTHWMPLPEPPNEKGQG